MWPGGEKIKRTRTDILFSEYIRERDDWTCQRCSKKFIQGVDSRGLHCAHMWFGRANIKTRWEPLNCMALCVSCHNYLGQHPGKTAELLMQRMPVEEFVWLHGQSDLTRKIKIPLDKELAAREKVKQLLYDVKKERAEADNKNLLYSPKKKVEDG